MHFLAARPEVQATLRTQVAAGQVEAIESAIEEILRIDDPFVANRRRTTAKVTLGGQSIEKGAPAPSNWMERPVTRRCLVL